MTTRDQKLANLAQAEAALHELMIGKRTASISLDGRSATYTQASLKDLQAYILNLKQELGLIRRGSRAGSFR